MRYPRLRGAIQLTQVSMSVNGGAGFKPSSIWSSARAPTHCNSSVSQLVSLGSGIAVRIPSKRYLLKAGNAGYLKSFSEFPSKYIYNLMSFYSLIFKLYFPAHKNKVQPIEKGNKTQYKECFCYL